MYVNPFLAGILTAVLAEVVILIGAIIIANIKEGRK